MCYVQPWLTGSVREGGSRSVRRSSRTTFPRKPCAVTREGVGEASARCVRSGWLWCRRRGCGRASAETLLESFEGDTEAGVMLTTRRGLHGRRRTVWHVRTSYTGTWRGLRRRHRRVVAATAEERREAAPTDRTTAPVRHPVAVEAGEQAWRIATAESAYRRPMTNVN